MRILPQIKDRVHAITVAIVIIIIIVSFGAAVWTGFQTSYAIKERLSEQTRTIASVIDVNDISKLKGNSSDIQTDSYKMLKIQLSEAKSINPDMRTVYIIGERDNSLFYYADSEEEGSSDYSAAGTSVDDATSKDLAIFTTGTSFVEGPRGEQSHDGAISALAPIYMPGTNELVAVVGVDMSTAHYWSNLIYAALVPQLAGLTIALIILVFERMRRHNEQLLALRSELVSVASHELRNPITGIRWAAESMQKITADERVLKMSDAILDSAMHLQTSTNDILELSHATNAKELNIQPTDISALMREVVETQSLSAQQKNVAVIFDKYWPVKQVIQCDPDQMRRALHNVVSNAIKYTRIGTVVTITFQQDAKHYKILVIDQGIGIPETEQSKVFNGFYRASNAVKSEIPGTGLGLYLVKTVFERHNGSVSFISEENHGTTFILILPRAR